MSWLPLRVETIPDGLRTQPWVLWRAEPAKGKPRKVPYRIAEPMVRASSTDPATWAPFFDAVEAYSVLAGSTDPTRGSVAGIGVVLTLSGGITCIDLDHVIPETGQLDPRAETIMHHANSWAEVSPSGTGLHIFARGRVPAAVKGPQIEIYSTARFIAVTGHQWPGTPDDVCDAQAYLEALYVRAHEGDRPPRSYTGRTTLPPDDLAGALLAKLQAWSVPVARIKRWEDGYLVELAACPWADVHTTGPGGAAVMIRASGAFDFTCPHAHCAGRRWREFRGVMESAR